MDKQGFKGIVRIKKFNKDGVAQKLFQGNKVWDFLHKIFNLDIQIDGLTGEFTYEGVGYNAVTNKGIEIFMKRGGGLTINALSHMAIGEGTGGTTALASEITTGGGERASVTPTSELTTNAGDTLRFVNTFSFTDAFAVTEEGLLNAGASGDLGAYRTFPAVNVDDGDSLEITHDLVGSAS